ncbi:MAG: hypothetical protein JSV02_05175, partial [Dehalococcoidia bacterium]
WNPMILRNLPTPVEQSTPVAAPSIAPTPTPVSTPVPLLTVVPTPVSQSAYIPNALFLQIIEPQDGSEIRSGDGIINGRTIPGAVISVFVNDDIIVADVNYSGDFSVEVVYELGPNMVEVLASDHKGNSIYSSFVVIGIY